VTETLQFIHTQNYTRVQKGVGQSVALSESANQHAEAEVLLSVRDHAA